MYPTSSAPQYQQQQPAYGAPDPYGFAPEAAPSLAPPQPPAPSTSQPMIINIQQNASAPAAPSYGGAPPPPPPVSNPNPGIGSRSSRGGKQDMGQPGE
ncbi:Oidioi.mRNA.OKI2018_I69.chr1.g1370.t1.cds [Oikopleura dioica]|uniref:Oidioi.mRNA.OKI2018_I69.chr1.g1370.t1.cds n=1 Tax=Oikopleura dioica TaxID=34765 RepID=A0ABN7SSX5_OIKDI|nr:Oidioi.mRNA.OKI2018_I69.chr1.g1370.t1.cds [Oikopleura dioica]